MTGLSEGEREAPSTSPSGNAVDGLRIVCFRLNPTGTSVGEESLEEVNRTVLLVKDAGTLEQAGSSGMTAPSIVDAAPGEVFPQDVQESLEEVNRTVLARVFWDDRAFISSTLLRGKFSLRICIINHTTTWEDVRETLEAAERFGSEELS